MPFSDAQAPLFAPSYPFVAFQGLRKKTSESSGEAKSLGVAIPQFNHQMDNEEPVSPSPAELKKTRRRLSVISANKLIEGVELDETMLQEPESVYDQHSAPSRDEEEESESNEFIITSYAGHSKKGYAPYNPRKKNQDALVMLEDSRTQSLCLGVLDGHGEFGDLVAQFLKAEIEAHLFSHPSFAGKAPSFPFYSFF